MKADWNNTTWQRMCDREGFEMWTRIVNNKRIFVARRGDEKPDEALTVGYASQESAIRSERGY